MLVVRHYAMKEILHRAKDDDRKHNRPSRNQAELVFAGRFLGSDLAPTSVLNPRHVHRATSLPLRLFCVRHTHTIASSAPDTGRNHSRRTANWSLASGIPVGFNSYSSNTDHTAVTRITSSEAQTASGAQRLRNLFLLADICFARSRT